ncbi:hypothetical protein [Bradyrhizobium sp. CCBAU 65884]|uniref:hypothetical protein n=1 Tax=Bradyrhizobium sp. CCBAU 65884 TaxID=722477 RepID=UPI002304ED08|nr:hypothetical protein [Bradyrhizobium sp. CCBAU 65884]
MASKRLEVWLRGLLLFLGLSGVIWTANTLPIFWAAVPAKDVAARIQVGDRFKSGAISDVLASMQAASEPVIQRGDVRRAEALMRLRIAEEAVGRMALGEADREAAAAADRLKFALALDPADSFLWLMLYFLEIRRNGFDARTVDFLNQSYAAGPLEGWIALHRNRPALAAFSSLDEALRAKVLAEFATLVDSGFVEAAAINLVEVGWEQRHRLLASLANTDMAPREALAKRLSREGLKVSVPGIEMNERLWR